MIATTARPVGLSPTIDTGSNGAMKENNTADKEVRSAEIVELVSRGIDALELKNAKATFEARKSSAGETKSTHHFELLPKSTFHTSPCLLNVSCHVSDP